MQLKDWNEAANAGVSALDAADTAWTEQSEVNGPLVITRASDIKARKVGWLWDQRLPRGKVVLVAGEGGLGKSMALAWIAATVSTGRDWPCGEGHSPIGSVIILSAEDDASDTILPRLMAADADCSKVYILSAVRREDEKGHRSFNLQHDLPALEKKIGELRDVVLVIIDPITSYLGAVDSHRNAELRSVLEPLGEMAARLGVTVIANTHLSKSTAGSANSRVIGSVAFVNHARAAFIVTFDSDDSGRRLFLPSKTNLGRACDGLAYRIADTVVMGGDGEVIWAPYVKWEDSTVKISADEAVAAMSGDAESRGAKEEAKTFLLQVLADGSVAAKEVKRQAEDAGISVASLRRAKSSLRVNVKREGFGPGSVVLWEMQNSRSPIGAHVAESETVSTYEQTKDFQRVAGGNGHIDAQNKEVSTYDKYERLRPEPEDFPELPPYLDRRAR